jgi:hypothetical protein
MSALKNAYLTGLLVLLMFPFFAGCISISVGDVGYTNGSIYATITNPGDPADTYIQVTVYKITDLQQKELTVANSPAMLNSGENTILIPAALEPGRYKCYVYLLSKGERKTAVIRDFVV